MALTLEEFNALRDGRDRAYYAAASQFASPQDPGYLQFTEYAIRQFWATQGDDTYSDFLNASIIYS